MAYNSSHTGAQIDSAVGTVIEKESTWDSKGAGDMLASVYDPQGKKQDAFNYAEQAIEAHRHEEVPHRELMSKFEKTLSMLSENMQQKITATGVLRGIGNGYVRSAFTEDWTFTLEDGSTVTKTIVLG